MYLRTSPANYDLLLRHLFIGELVLEEVNLHNLIVTDGKRGMMFIGKNLKGEYAW